MLPKLCYPRRDMVGNSLNTLGKIKNSNLHVDVHIILENDKMNVVAEKKKDIN